MNNPKKNFMYNIIYQILILIIPLLTSPYLARVIGVNGVGIYSYTYSIVNYFMLFTLLGVNNYGNRSIAKVRDNKEKLSKTFWSIYIFQLLMGILMLAVYVAYILVFDNSYKTIAIIEVLFLVSSIMDINWFFFGMEEFKITITRNTIVKVLNIVLIFTFVKNNNDLWKYTLIMSSMTLIGQIILWRCLIKKIQFMKISYKDVIKHIKPNLILFVPVIAISLYKMMDKIMLGSISNVTEVGYYENAEKIINIPMSFITALGTVMLPRVTNLMSNGSIKKVEQYINKSISFVMFMSSAMCCGLIAIGYNFAPLFFGNEFQKTGILIMLLSTTLIFLSFANVIRTQYLIPKEKDKIYITSVCLGAFFNLIMNLIFIPVYGSVGACFGTIAAEFIVMFYQALSIRKELPIYKYIKNTIPFIIKSLIMLAIIYPLNLININNILRLGIQIILGINIYGLLNLKYLITTVIPHTTWKKISREEEK